MTLRSSALAGVSASNRSEITHLTMLAGRACWQGRAGPLPGSDGTRGEGEVTCDGDVVGKSGDAYLSRQ